MTILYLIPKSNYVKMHTYLTHIQTLVLSSVLYVVRLPTDVYCTNSNDVQIAPIISKLIPLISVSSERVT